MSLLGIRHLPREEIEDYVARARVYQKAAVSGEPVPQIEGSTCLLFFEVSTRTRISFERAARRLGLQCTYIAPSTSSISKGESFRDTVATLDYEGLDCLIIRHPCAGTAHQAAEVFSGTVVNGGDGCHEHPTQALADLMTVLSRKGGTEGLVVAIVGDIVHSRVARSNAWCLTKMGAHVRFVAPATLLPKDPSAFPVEVHDNLAAGLADADVVMALRLQRERMNGSDLGSLTEYTEHFQVNGTSLALAKEDVLVMHPGPMNRGVELDSSAADSPGSTIHEQVENGVYIRMAVLAKEFEKLRGDA
jgi:aspartate carbamoyltransferase catalytic subunit